MLATVNYFKVSKFFLFIVPISFVIFTRSALFPFIVGKYVWFRTSVDLALIFFLLGLLLAHNKKEIGDQLRKIMRAPLTIAASTFAVMFTLAGFFGRDPSYSFWSNFERGEGSLQIIHLVVFFILMSVLFKERKDWIKLFWVAVVSALLVIGYGIGAGLELFGSGFFSAAKGMQFGAPDYRFHSTIGNPAYAAALFIFSMFYAAYIWFEKYRRKKFSTGSILLIVSIIAFLAFFLLAATRGAFIGLGAGVFAMLAYLTYSNKRWRAKLIVTGVILLIAGGLLIGFSNTELVQRIPGSRIFDITITAQTFQHRTIMWGVAWESFLERPLLGWGAESYGYLFQRNFNPAYFEPSEGFGAWFDRAHSIYLDYLAETGILGFLSYFSMFVIFYWQILKKKPWERGIQSLAQGALTLAIPITYLVQGIVLFDVLVIYINVFIVLAFGNYLIMTPKPAGGAETTN